MSEKNSQDNMTEVSSAKKGSKAAGIVKEILSWVIVIVVAVALGYMLNAYVILKAEIPSGSMETTLNVGDHLIGNRLAYVFSDPKRGDIVMFDYPDDETKMYVKRVIGLPGEHVEIIDGLVYIDHSTTPLNEPYLKEQPEVFNGSYDVPAGYYFVMGDNRNNSWDSRKWTNTYVAKEKIHCKAWFRYKPDFTFIK